MTYITHPCVRLHMINRSNVFSCALPRIERTDEALRYLSSLPQFKNVDLESLVRRNEPHRLILLSEDRHTAIHLAAYLSALRELLRKSDRNPSTESPVVAAFSTPSHFPGRRFETQIPHELRIIPSDIFVKEESSKSFRKQKSELSFIETPALIYADSGPVFTEPVVQDIHLMFDTPSATVSDIFLALKPSQFEREKVAELCFYYGFQLCKLEPPTTEYFCSILDAALQRNDMTLDPSFTTEDAVAAIRQFRGKSFNASDLEIAVANAAHQALSRDLTLADLLPPLLTVEESETGAIQRLDSMIGLNMVKDKLRKVIAAAKLEAVRGQSSRPFCRNLTFAGSPGTGKTETARLYAEALRECGVCSGIFREVGREDLVGQYVGHTAPKIEQLFREVQGGVLFFDEAGSLTQIHEHDSFTKEAVDSFVRHMENHPETIVIFATYEDEMSRLLSSNPGLSSRFGHNIVFPDYSDDELWQILNHIAARDQYTIPEEAYDVCTRFFSDLRNRKGRDFGNGREARRLLEHAIEEFAMRATIDPALKLELSVQDFRNAAESILGPAPTPTKRPIGFQVS